MIILRSQIPVLTAPLTRRGKTKFATVNYHEPYKTGDHEHTLLEQHLKNTHLMTKQIWNSPDELVRFVNK